ncbi:MAG: Hsp20/alpha crystallin family protein [Gammaproteobacteria bacterium]
MAEKETKKEEKAIAPRSTGLTPFEEMDRWFEEMSRDMFGRRWLSPFERLFSSFPEFRSTFEGRMPFEGRVPRADLIDREAELVIRAALPGITKEDLEVSLTDDAVTVRAKTRHEKKEETGEYHRRELSQGEFQRSFRLPAAVKGAAAKATFKDGILELVLPKVEPAKRKTIKVE